MADLERSSQEIARLVAGPFEELRRAGVFEHGAVVSRELEQMKSNIAMFDARFCLPEFAETAQLLTELLPGISETLKRYTEEQSRFRRAIESMRTPWLDMEKKLRSFGGLTALQGIGHAVRNMPAFGQELNAALRIDLGDWRDPITWRPEILTDLGSGPIKAFPWGDDGTDNPNPHRRMPHSQADRQAQAVVGGQRASNVAGSWAPKVSESERCPAEGAERPERCSWRGLRSLKRKSVQEAFRCVLTCQGPVNGSLPGNAQGFRGQGTVERPGGFDVVMEKVVQLEQENPASNGRERINDFRLRGSRTWRRRGGPFTTRGWPTEVVHAFNHHNASLSEGEPSLLWSGPCLESLVGRGLARIPRAGCANRGGAASGVSPPGPVRRTWRGRKWRERPPYFRR